MKSVLLLAFSLCLFSTASSQDISVKVSVTGDLGIKEQVTSKLNRHFRQFKDVKLVDGDYYFLEVEVIVLESKSQQGDLFGYALSVAVRDRITDIEEFLFKQQCPKGAQAFKRYVGSDLMRDHLLHLTSVDDLDATCQKIVEIMDSDHLEPLRKIRLKESTQSRSPSQSVAKLPSETTTLEDNNFLVYRDSKYLFSAWYPKTWTTVPASNPQTRFKVRSENGFDDYSINVTSPASLKNMTPKQFVEMMNKSDPVELLRPHFPDAVLLKKGGDYLSNQDAFFFIYKGTYRTAGVEIPITVMQWQTIKHGYLYTLTCRAESEGFETMLPVFQKILYGFVLQVNRTRDTSSRR